MVVGVKTSGGSFWSRDDDIAFERALAVYTAEIDNRWEKIADVVPGKTLEQVIKHYEKLLRDVMLIESGSIPFPDYNEVPEETNVRERCIGERGIDHKCKYKQEDEPKPKPNRRKAIPWSPLEHSQFVLGLKKYGKGDWRSISRHVVLTRTPTQVASHAQKYFARLKATNRSRQRHSIHDVNIAESSNISATEAPVTWQDAQATSKPSFDHHAYETPTIWNTKASSQPSSLDHPTYATPTMWNTQSTSPPSSLDHPTYVTTPTIWNTQATSQPSSLDHPTYATPTMWNTQSTSPPSSLDHPTYATTPTIWNTQATSQPSSLDHPTYATPTIWNTQSTSSPSSLDHPTYATTPTIWNTQITSPPSVLDHHVFRTPTIWNMQAASQPPENVPGYGTSSIGQSMVTPYVLPYGADMNLLAAPYMAYGVQHPSVPHTSVSRAPFNTGLFSDNMTYISTSR
ncbi:Homeodomain-like transcriptional regulator [Raphanus sativus]|nr:Homeodomain-like transcriptional regulator [Raphanus sativus]